MLPKFCGQCGNSRPSAESRFCDACGHRFDAAGPGEDEARQASAEAEPEVRQRPPDADAASNHTAPSDVAAPTDADVHTHSTPPRLPTSRVARALPMLGGVVVLAAGVLAVVHVYRPDLTAPALDWIGGPGDASAVADEPPAPRHPGAAWHGVEGGMIDFVAAGTREVATDTVVYPDRTYAMRYRSVARDGARVDGTLEVQTMGPRLSAFLADETGEVVRGFNGTFSPDGRLVSGSTWPIPEGSPLEGTSFWWATVERIDAPPHPDRLDVNALTVVELESLGMTPRAARLVVEGRLGRGPYLSLAPLLENPHLTPAQRRLLRERGHVR